jgi:hypothetical protein
MAEVKKTPREAENRNTTQRVKKWAPSGGIPNIVNLDPAYHFHWIRVSLNGSYDAKNVAKKFREGMEICKLADHPEFLHQTEPNTRFKDGIEIGGLLLCKIPTDLYKQRKDYFENQTQAQADAVDNNFMRQNDARMPLFAERKSGTSFGKGK